MHIPELRSSIVLTEPSPADAVAHFAGEDNQTIRWLSGGTSTLATVRAYLARSIEQWNIRGPIHAFAIRVGDPPQLAGMIEVQFDRGYLPPDQINLAYCVYPAFRGRRVASTAVQLACAHAASNQATQAVIRAHPENMASLAVAHRCGFVHQYTSNEGEQPLQWWIRDLTDASTEPVGSRP